MGHGDGRESLSRSRVVSRARRVDATLGAAVGALPDPRAAWRPPSGPAVVGSGAAETIVASGPERFRRVRERATALLTDVDAGDSDAPGPRLVGGFAFTDDHEPTPPWRGFPGARFVLPRVQVARSDGETWVRVQHCGPDADAATVEAALDEAAAVVADAPPVSGASPGVVSTTQFTTRAAWREQVEAVVERIRGGALQKVVLACALRADLGAPVDDADVVAAFADGPPDTYRFAVAPGAGATFFGATPERLVARSGRVVETEALAGSTRRGDTVAADDRLAASLRDSEKDQHEHALVVEAIRDQLAPVAASIGRGEQSVRRLDSVQHLHTPVTATLETDVHVLDLVERLHPTPAVGGLPPDAALATIQDTETFDRGWYAAPVGWFDAAGDGEFAVGIRSAVASGRTATLFAGNGIVADSDPDDEWAEVQLKFDPMLEHLR
jgi:menaquinone-specific isochorismate synthase